MSTFSCYGIIPARYASSRLPGKPLADIGGRPCSGMCCNALGVARRWTAYGWATDDERVVAAAAELDVPCVSTSPDHPSGTDRVREAAVRLNLPMDAVIVNIQGDEPLLEPAMLDELTAPFADGKVGACTLATPLDPADPADAALIASPHQVKVVMDEAAMPCIFPARPFLLRGTRLCLRVLRGMWGCTPFDAMCWNALRRCPPRRWSNWKNWSSCVFWNTAYLCAWL